MIIIYVSLFMLPSISYYNSTISSPSYHSHYWLIHSLFLRWIMITHLMTWSIYLLINVMNYSLNHYKDSLWVCYFQKYLPIDCDHFTSTPHLNYGWKNAQTLYSTLIPHYWEFYAKLWPSRGLTMMNQYRLKT